MRVAEAFQEAAAGRLPVIVQVGHNSLAEACELASHAASLGVEGISATPPSYFRPGSVADAVSCAAHVAGAAPGTPFYYYHIPTVTGVDLSMPDFVAEARARIPNFRGLKFSDSRQFALQACLEAAGPDLEVFNGVDEMLLGAAAIGVRSAVGSTYNFAAPLYLRMLDRLKAGDLEGARFLQGRSVAMIDVILRTCGLGGWKAVLALLGMDCGPSRLPLRTPDEAERKRLRDELDRVGFFEWAR
jgi:N-acetylneuraminate lyase